jgi:colanic acid biosynthesis glycosyl transferase WcaI
MRVIVWGINYAPEVTGIAPYNLLLCNQLRRLGHEVEVVTSFAYYPAWKKRPEDAGHFYRTDVIDEVAVHRCWHFVPRRVSAAKRILHEGSFVLTSFLRLLAMPRAEVMVVISPPLLLGTAAWLLRLIKGTPFVFHVQDLQPDAALGLGMLKPGLLSRLLYGLERVAYTQAARVSGISPGMMEAFGAKGVPEAKRVYFPNSLQPLNLTTLPARGAFRRRQMFDDNAFLAIYSGNLGVKQGLGILLEAAALLQDSRVRIVICGDGAERQALESAAAKRNLANMRFLPLQPQAEYEEMMVDTDVCLITQQAGSGRAFFPSKLLMALNFAKAVLTVADLDSELAWAVAEGQFGRNLETGQPAALACELEAMAAAPEEVGAWGKRGRAFAERFDVTRVHEAFERCLQLVAREG